jgi:hypothetical protein
MNGFVIIGLDTLGFNWWVLMVFRFIRLYATLRISITKKGFNKISISTIIPGGFFKKLIKQNYLFLLRFLISLYKGGIKNKAIFSFLVTGDKELAFG